MVSVFMVYKLMLMGGFVCSYIVLKDYEQATKVLFRRSDSRSLKLALDLAKKSGNTELCKAVEVRYNAFKDADKVLEVLQSVTEEKANVEEESN